MKLTNQNTNETLEIDAVWWTNEDSYTGFDERREFSTTGVDIRYQQAKQSGEQMQFTGSDDRNWVNSAVLKKLRQWNRTMDLTLLLDINLPFDSRVFKVSFDNTTQAIKSQPVIDNPEVKANTFYHLQELNFRVHKEIIQ